VIVNGVEIVLILLASAVVLAIVAQRIQLPYPIILLVGGAVLGFTPGVPRLEIEPEIVLVIFLPPLLFSAAWLTSWQHFREHVRTIGLLAIGLVIATTAGVAAVAHVLIGLPWGVAFVLGAIVSPPDAVAATSVMQRLRVPPRLVTILEGESLVNDATGLVAYQVALAAVAGEAFSAARVATQFAIVGIGGVAFGFAVGWLVAKVHRRLDDLQVETAISLLTPYIAYIPAEHLGVSGVLAAVTAGGYLGWRSPALFSPVTRLRSASVWSTVLFLFNGLVFILMGLELAGTHRLLGKLPVASLIGWCAAITATTIAIRLLWVPVAVRLPWKERAIVGWTAMRGIVSLALVLALPDAFPDRDLIILLVFAVIAVTLLGQGLSLPVVIRALRVTDDGDEPRREREALVAGADAALAHIDTLEASATVDVLRKIYSGRRERLDAQSPDGSASPMAFDRSDFRRMRGELLAVERDVYVEMRNAGKISEEMLQRLLRDLDLEMVQPLR
jgi:Na+/H+ antiporter